MARNTGKRKSESALPQGKSKFRKTASRRIASDSSQPSEESSEGELFIQEEERVTRHVGKAVVNKSCRSEPVRRATRDGEYEEDEGRMESQQFLALVEFESKKKRKATKAAAEYVDKFTQVVRADERNLENHIEALSDMSKMLDTDFLDAFTDAFAASRPTGQPSKNYKGKNLSVPPVFATLYDKTQRLTAKALEVVEKFEVASHETASIDTSNLVDKESWGRDLEWCEQMLDTGHEIGLEKYQHLLMASKAPVIENEEDEDNRDFEQVMFPDDPLGPTVGWGKIAKKSMKAVKRLAKASLEVVAK